VKRETIITAIVFLGVGFLAGYIYEAQRTASLQQTSATPAASAGPSQASADSTGSQASPDASASLPPGHPPVNEAAMIRLLEQEVAQNPTDPARSLKLANLFYDKRQFQQAIEWYEKALALDPANADARTDLGTSYFNLGRTQDALREFHRSLEINPQHRPTLFNLIVVNLEGAHDLRAAEDAWQKLHKLDPGYKNLDFLKQELDAARASAAK